MSATPQVARPPSAHPTHLRTLAVALRDFLVRTKHRVDAEIGTYPTPIPRCDAQFNHLYEQRSRIARTLYRVSGALDGDDPREDLGAVLGEFAAMPSLAESPEERDLRERIRIAIADARSAPARAAQDHAQR